MSYIVCMFYYSLFISLTVVIRTCLFSHQNSLLIGIVHINRHPTYTRFRLLLTMHVMFDLSSHFSVSVIDFYIQVVFVFKPIGGASDGFVCIINTIITPTVSLFSGDARGSDFFSASATLAAAGLTFGGTGFIAT